MFKLLGFDLTSKVKGVLFSEILFFKLLKTTGINETRK